MEGLTVDDQLAGNSTGRRRILRLFALAATLPLWAKEPAHAQASDLTSLLDLISDALIPGSAAQRPGSFLISMIPSEFCDLTLERIDVVADALRKRGEMDFRELPPSQRESTLAGLDSDAYAQNTPEALAMAWKTLKLALLSTYYSSEKGASRDLEYVLVPGRWEPDIKLSEHPRALWSDTWARWLT